MRQRIGLGILVLAAWTGSAGAQDIGACCLDNGTCYITDQAACAGTCSGL